MKAAGWIAASVLSLVAASAVLVVATPAAQPHAGASKVATSPTPPPGARGAPDAAVIRQLVSEADGLTRTIAQTRTEILASSSAALRRGESRVAAERAQLAAEQGQLSAESQQLSARASAIAADTATLQRESAALRSEEARLAAAPPAASPAYRGDGSGDGGNDN